MTRPASGRLVASGDRRGRSQMLRGECDLTLDLPDLLSAHERAMPSVVPIFLEGLSEVAEARLVDVDASSWAAGVVLPDEDEQRDADAVDVGEGVAAVIALRDVRGLSTEQGRVVLLQRFHLVFECSDVVPDRHDADAERPALGLHADSEERQ